MYMQTLDRSRVFFMLVTKLNNVLVTDVTKLKGL